MTDHHAAPDIWDFPSDDVIGEQLTALAATVEAGETAKRDRADLIRIARRKDPQRWTQERLAEASGISQQAVAKTLARKPSEDTLSTRHDVPYLVGRLLGVADILSGMNGAAWKLADKMVEGRWPINDESIQQLRAFMEKDLARSQQAQRFEAALDDIDDHLAEVGTLVLTDTTHVALLLGYDHQRGALLDR